MIGSYLQAARSPLQTSRCDRRGQCAKTQLIEDFCGDLRLPDLLRLLAPDCPSRNSLNNQSCGAFYPALRLSVIED
jgi:hypothetical protein